MKITRELLDRIIKEPEKFQVLEQNPFEVLYDNDELPKVFREDLVNDKYNKRIVILKNGQVSDIDLFEAVKSGNRHVMKDDYLVKTAKELGIYIGDE